MLKIKLQRRGMKRTPIYRISVMESSKKRDGKPVEVLGTYNPKTKELIYNTERAKHWQAVGAQATETAAALLKKEPKHDLVNGHFEYKFKTIEEKTKERDELYGKNKKPSKKQLAKDKEEKEKEEQAKKEAEEAKASESEEAPAEEEKAAE